MAAMALALSARGLLLLSLALVALGQDDSAALVQRGLRVHQSPASVDLPEWVKNLISSGSEEEAGAGSPGEEDISEDEQKALDDEAEHGEDFYINYTALEEQDAMEDIANATAPMLKWLYLTTAFYESAREYTNSHIGGDWRYEGRPGKFSINSNPQGELVYHTPDVPDHEAIGILLPISDGPWQLQAVVRDGEQRPLSHVRIKAMTNVSNLVVSFADVNITRWSRDVLASRSTPLDKIFTKKPAAIVPAEKPRQEQNDKRLSLDNIDKACLGPLMLTPDCIKKHGIPKRGGILGNQGSGEVKKSHKSRGDLFNMARKLISMGKTSDKEGIAKGLDTMQAVADAFLGKGPGQDNLLKDIMDALQNADPETAMNVVKAVFDGLGESLGMDLNVTKVFEQFMGGKPGGVDMKTIFNIAKGLFGDKSGGVGTGDFMKIMQGLGSLGGGKTPPDFMGIFQGLLGGTNGTGSVNPADFLPLVQGLLGGGDPGAGGGNPADFLPLVQGLLGGGKEGGGLDMGAIMQGLQAFFPGGKEGGGVDMGAIMQGLQALFPGLPTGSQPSSNKTLAEHMAGFFDSDDPDAYPGEKKWQALHRKFSAMRHDLGIGGHSGANRTSDSASKGVIKSLREGFANTFGGGGAANASGNESSSKKKQGGLFSSWTASEERRREILYGHCHNKLAHDIANYSVANETAMGTQMWWPYELRDSALDYGWLVDHWENTASVDVGHPIPADGLITGWEWYGTGTHTELRGARLSSETVYFQVLRWVGGGLGKQFELVGQSLANTTVLREKNELKLSPEEYLNVKKGDFVGFYSPHLTAFGYSMAKVCDLQVMLGLGAPTEIGGTAEYVFAGEKSSPRAYHFHAQYVTETPAAQLARRD